MEALTNTTPLAHELHMKSGATLKTISDAALFITKLPKEYDGRLHWRTAGAALEAADRRPTDSLLLLHATQSLKNALQTDNLLKNQ